MKKTLLLVDDEDSILSSLIRLLRDEDYRILTAASGEKALEILAINDVHVILSDHRMPHMLGPEFLSCARELYPDTVRLILSGNTDFASLTDAINHGNIYKFLLKPWDDDLIRTIIREAFNRYELERRGTQFAKLYENTVEGILVVDAENLIQAVNPAFTAITGFTPEEVIGKNMTILYADKYDGEFFQQMWNSLRQDGKWAGEIWSRHKNGVIHPEWLNITAIHDSQGKLKQHVTLFTNITSHKQTEERLRYQAYHDSLTGLPNRQMYMENLDLALAQAGRRSLKCGVIMLDIDRFKYINDTFGHDFGDKLLIEVAHRLRKGTRKEDILARMGGDEFTFLLPLIKDTCDVSRVAKKILAEFVTPVLIDGKEMFVTPSIGISLFPNDGMDAAALLKKADIAMYQVKQHGRNAFRFYTTDTNEQLT